MCNNRNDTNNDNVTSVWIRADRLWRYLVGVKHFASERVVPQGAGGAGAAVVQHLAAVLRLLLVLSLQIRRSLRGTPDFQMNDIRPKKLGSYQRRPSLTESEGSWLPRLFQRSFSSSSITWFMALFSQVSTATPACLSRSRRASAFAFTVWETRQVHR